ncbi:OLC1v1021301C1 [Oldenlandia corymbosa var. corymbosa]|uniref:OLC1v1021301C1 n=1 Tax=Oldenlandia corymbosa var. corymbosa TaxID=529605 RepID=A0AAV1BXK7_OLDCO|nr:OLC1v1021301C1 [Oldenlandia corymbosa var. corymbosa]
MEKKQLNLNAPLLSVRKPVSKLGFSEVKNKLSMKSGPIRQQSLPPKKSEWELGEVAKPGAVPFRWEQIPGKTKGEYEEQTETPKRSASAPRLPPGRVPDTIMRYSGERCNDPKNVIVRRYSGDRCSDQKSFRTQSQVYPYNDHAALIASLKESLNANEGSDAGSADDAYSDAVDTISPSASFSFNCSVSGLSEFEVSNVKQSGDLEADAQTRDFMMSRFLPAAKAAVVETPQYVPKKQPPVVTEQPKQPKKVVSGERKPLLDRLESDFASFYNEYIEDGQSEVEVGDNQANEPKKRSRKAWGIFPRLCVKKSLCLFNPVPAIKTRSQVPNSPPTDIGRLTRKAYSGPLDKRAWDPNNKRIFHSGVLTRELHQVEKKQGESKPFAYTSYKAGGLSPCRPFRSGEISPYRNAAPHSPFRKGARFLGLPNEADNLTAEKYSSLIKKCSNLLDAAPPRVSRQGGVTPNEAVEKTVYVDSVTTVDVIKGLDSSRVERPFNSVGDKLKISAETKKVEDNLPDNIGNLEVKPSNAMKEGTKLDAKVSSLAHEVPPASNGMSKLRVPAHGPGVLELSKSISEEKRSLVKSNESEAENSTDAVALQSPLAPPLPKSPSESWLWRTIHLRIPFSPSHHGKNFHIKKDQKASVPKWETMVKSSNLSDNHSRYSEVFTLPHCCF